MIARAKALEIKGVAVVAFYAQEIGLVSRMQIVESRRNEAANFIAIVYAKMAEMCDTLQDSGSGVREPLRGELGYVGGAIRHLRKLENGVSLYCLTAFSGASSEEDLDVSKCGMALVETLSS